LSAPAAAAPASQPLFSPRVVLWIVLVGVFSFCAFMALLAYAPDLRSGRDGGAHALSKSAVGFAGMAKLLEDLGTPAVITRGPPPAVKGGTGVLILTPTPFTDGKQLRAFKFGGIVLVVLPKWMTSPQPLNPGWVDRQGLIAPDVAAGPLKGLAIERRKDAAPLALTPASADEPIFGGGEAFTAGRIESLQTVSGKGWRPLLVDARGKAVLAMSTDPALFVLSDPDLLNTHGVADLATARAARAMLDDLRNDGPVVFDVTLNGFKRGRSLLKLALEPPLLGVTICLLAAAAMMGLHAAGRFGPPQRSQRSVALGKQALADNSAALVRMARREHRMAAGYAALVRDSVARAVGAPRDLDPGELDALLDRLAASRAGVEGISGLMAAAQAAANDTELMAAARRLYQWRREMVRDGR
jgi:hypothetical protein